MTGHWKDWLREIRGAHPRRNTYAETMERLGALDKTAVWITDRVGTMGFFLCIFVWSASWLSWNLLAPPALRFDPPMGFVFWLFISNLIQILLMPLIMVGQNIQGKHAEARAQYDLDVNVKAEQEIEVILHHIEEQNDMLIAMLETLGVDSQEALKRIRARRGTLSFDGPRAATSPPQPQSSGTISMLSASRGKTAILRSAAAIILIVLLAVAAGTAVYLLSGHTKWP